MQPKQKQFLILLAVGFVLSGIVKIEFSLNPGFVFHGLNISLPLPLFDFAEESGQTRLSTELAGYLFYAIAGLVFIGELKSNKRWLLITLGFILVTLYAVYFEASAWAAGMSGEYNGEHMSIGPILFLLGLLIYAKQKIIAAR
jgi:hypothetical protein